MPQGGDIKALKVKNIQDDVGVQDNRELRGL